MASDETFVQFILDQIQSAGVVRSRKMFGEYALYCNDKVVGLVCDNQLFVKATEPGREFLGKPTMASPYPKAKPAFLIRDEVEDHLWLSELIRRTEAALPPPKRRKKRTSR